VPTSKEALREALLARVISDYATLEANYCSEDPELATSLADIAAPSEEELLGVAPDPDYGPPDPEDAWVLDLPGELLDEYFAALPSPPDPAEIGAGFWHSSKGDGSGFASGGTSDTLAPGPVLAGLAERVWDGGLDHLDDDALVGVLCAARRLTSWAGALELAATASLANRRLAAEAAGKIGVAEHVDDEIAAALTLTGRAAGRLLDLAQTLDRLPATMAALRAGEIDQPRAAVIADETALLGPTHRPAVEAHLLRRAAGQTTGELRAAAKRAVIAVDPAAARKRKEKAQRDARVERWEEEAGTAALAGRDLPPAGVLAADQYLSGIARSLKDAGVEGTMDNLRALAYLTLLAGQPVSSLFPTTPDAADVDAGDSDVDAADADADANAATTAGATIAEATTVTEGGRAARGAAAHGSTSDVTSRATRGMSGFTLPPLTGSVNLTMPLATWLGLSEAPGSAAGYGPLDASDARLLGTALAERADTKWCITLTDAEGRPVAHGCASPRSRKDQRSKTRAGPDQGSSAGAAPGWGGTTQAASGGDGTTRAEPGGAGAARAGAARAGAARTGTARTGTPGAGAARAGPGWDGIAWNFALAPLPADPCSHLRETAAYRPSPGLRHVLEIRHATCTYIGCRRPAERCDQDHTVPYDRGGRTCACNLGPGCRRHHKAKQTPGWRLEQSQPGYLTWTTPNGRSYTTGPTQYLE
jgi:uncharacterized protein DUF222